MMPPGAKYTQYTWTSPLPLARCTLDAATASNSSMGRACSLENSSLFIRCLSEEARLYSLRPAANYSGPIGVRRCRIASSHGGRATESLRATHEALPEVV